MQQLNQLLARLIKAEVEFVLVGGLAASIHGSSLMTRDVDVCCRFTAANLLRIQHAFADQHPVHRMRPDLPLALTPEQCVDLKNLYIKTDLGVIDCLGSVLGVGEYDEVFKHSMEIELPVGKLRILDLDTLIQAKEATGRRMTSLRCSISKQSGRRKVAALSVKLKHSRLWLNDEQSAQSFFST